MSKLEFRSCSCLYDLTFVTKKATLCFEEFKDLLEKFGHKLPYVFFYSYNDIHIVCCKLSIKFFMQKDEKLYADCSEVCPKETCDANSVNFLIYL